MGSSSFSCFFTLMLLVFSFCLFQLSVADHYSTTPSVLQRPLCHDNERFALLQFNRSLIVDDTTCSYDPSFSYPKVGSWKLQDCCSWDGIKCDKDTGHVIRLNLTGSCLSGSINSTSTLFRLVHLQWLSLAGNNFNDSKIPSGIKNLSKLSHLDLSDSDFSDQIPSEILELSQLKYLDLSLNWLQLQQPGLRSLVEKLTNLEMLNLQRVIISSSIPSSLANLSLLTHLSLQDCQLQGTIPSSLGNLSKLVYLDISYNDFNGELPTLSGNITHLRYLDLSYNNFSVGNSSLLSWIGKQTKLTYLGVFNVNLIGESPFWLLNLTQLTYLDMSQNQLTGPIPFWITNLNRLSTLDLKSNQLTGQIPSRIGNLTRLIHLDLSSNRLQDSIPSSMIELKNLQYLNLYSNKLNGTLELDMYLLKLKSLKVLVLSSNNLSVFTKNTVNTTLQKFSAIELGSCNLTVFPNFLQNQDELFGLDLSSNNLSGQIPRWFLNISIGNLESLNLSNNHLTGFDQHHVVLPWIYLDTIDLRSNKLYGSLPLPLPSSYILYYLASNNKLIGEIPPGLCRLDRLQALDLSYNNLSGVLPQCLGNFSNHLSILGLQGNNFYGSIPETFMIGSNLRMIDLSRNNFQGKIPRSIANCTSLGFLNLGYNQITGTFPSWLGILSELQVLILKSNKFHGVIRESGTNSSEFSKLHIIDLSHNRFKGELPSRYFQRWNSMKVVDQSQLTYMEDILQPSVSATYAFFDFSSYAYAFMMNNKGIEIMYGKISNKLTSISLSGNKFTGEIPESISDLRGLNNLNLSNNNLFGHIPSSMSNLKVLESLDLSKNKLFGEIPHQLAELTFLEFIDVSNNHLTGPIPEGPQFDTFENISFVGNPGLCGKPLSKQCGNLEASVKEDQVIPESTVTFDWKIVLIGFASGLIVGVVLGNEFCMKITEWLATTFGWQLRTVKRSRGHRN